MQIFVTIAGANRRRYPGRAQKDFRAHLPAPSEVVLRKLRDFEKWSETIRASLYPYFMVGAKSCWLISTEPDLGLTLPKAERLRAAVGQKPLPAKFAVWPSDEKVSRDQVTN
ncbi:hypothetical protein EV286_103261 [Rhizobium sp. BK251]|nr:hypothetical protein EV286_103261 [Rhizobium sp. BK251]